MKRINPSALAEAIDRRARGDLAENNIGGATVLVAQDDAILYKNHFSDGDFSTQTVSDDTLFRLASMTKPITAVATMILVERGLLSLDDRVDRFYPAFSSMEVWGESEKQARPITVRNLLTHSSGIGSGEPWTAAVKIATDRDLASVESFVDFLSRQPLSFQPGEREEYSGIGAFSVLTGILQQITGMPYGDFLQREIFEPCHMRDTTFTPTAEQWGRLIPMHDKKDGRSLVGNTVEDCVFERIPTSNPLGGAGLIASAEDYLHFARMLLAGGAYEGRRVLTEASVEAICRPQFPKRHEEAWGLGVRVICGEGTSVLPVDTYGWSGAYGTHFWVDPQNGIIGLYMKNSHYDGGAGAVTSKHFEQDVYASLE